MLGRTFLRAGNRLGHDVIGTYGTFAMPGLLRCDANDERAVDRLLSETNPDTIVYCAGWSWVDACESDPAKAFLENCELPRRAAASAHSFGARFVYFSSSYVFDGHNGPYTEDAPENPISVYGRSKLAGEHAVTEVMSGAALIVRTMGVYGVEPQGKNFVYQVVRNLRTGRPMKVPNDQLGNATEASNLAYGALALLEARAGGIWNLAGPDPNLARSAFALEVARTYRLDSSLLEFVPTASLNQPAPRPLRGGLVTDKTASSVSWRARGWTPPKMAACS